MSWDPVDLVALGDQPLPSPTIGGLSYPGCLAIHFGEPDNVKTWENLILCLEEIRGGRCALWLDFEMNAPVIRGRLRSLGASDDDLARFLYIGQPDTPISADGVQQKIEQLLDEHKPTLCVIDAMAGALELHGLDGNNNDDVERLYKILRALLCTRGVTVHVIDHLAKDRDTRGDWPIGAQRKRAGADVAIKVEMLAPFGKGQTGAARLKIVKDRHGAISGNHSPRLELVSDPDTLAITWTLTRPRSTDEQGEQPSDTWRPTALMDRVLAHVTHPAYEPVSRSALATKDHVAGKRTYVLQAIDCLVADGLLTFEDKKVVPVPRNVPRNDSEGERSHVPSLHTGTPPGTLFGNASEEAA